MSVSRPLAKPRGHGLIFADPDGPGIRRLRSGEGFSYRDATGKAVGASERRRIKSLVIPPAWRDVWISPDPRGHIQAVGRDARGRRQYRYHARFREEREAAKYSHIIRFATALPAIRDSIEKDMRRPGLPREKVIATIIHLLENTLIRVGNAEYAKHNKSYGLTTLKASHVVVDGFQATFSFKGKSGKRWTTSLADRRVANVIKACQGLPGQLLFQYLDESGERRAATSGDINDYLREVSRKPITAKDFRTWAGTVLAALALQERGGFSSQRLAKRNLNEVIAKVAARLGNTPAICRKCYIHPRVIDAYLDGRLPFALKRAAGVGGDEGLDPEEAMVLRFLRGRSGARAKAREPKATSGEGLRAALEASAA